MRSETGTIEDSVRALLVDVLGISRERVSRFDDQTGLFGSLPELDSMAVATLLTEMEDRLGIVIDDDEVDAELLETFGNLVAFGREKIARSMPPPSPMGAGS